MFGTKKPDVLVVGAGPVGMMAALMLAKRGVEVMIIDKERQKAGKSYALGIHPGAFALFDELGLLGEIKDRSYTVNTIGFYDKEQRRAEVRLNDLHVEDSFLAILPQAILERLLEEALARNGVKVHWSHRLGVIKSQPDGAKVEIDKLEKESLGYSVSHTGWMVSKTITLDVPFVIGADGHASNVRRQLDIDYDRVGDSQKYGVLEFNTNADMQNESKVVLNENSSDVLWPLSSDTCRWSFELPDDVPLEEQRQKDRLQFSVGPANYPWLSEESLKKIIEERAPWFEGNMEEMYWGIEVMFERRLAQSFGRNRVWLVGDSAHMTDPVGLQSMNVGFDEAKELTSKIAGVLDKSGSVDALEDYNQTRLQEWKVLQGLQGDVHATSETDAWITKYQQRFISCLPGHGKELEQMLGQLKLEMGVGVS